MRDPSAPLPRYPAYEPGGNLASAVASDWTEAEARRYLVWQTNVLDVRVRALLDFLGVEDAGPPRELLLTAGQRAALALKRHSASTSGEEGPTLTAEGLALAADMGLLVARELLRSSRGQLRWEVLRKPRTAAAFNLPVLVGDGKPFLEPLRASIANAHAVVAGRRDGGIWARMFSERINPNDSPDPSPSS